MNPNKYNQRLTLLKRTSTLETVYGEHQESFQPAGDLWAYVQFTGGGNEGDDYGVRKELVQATIYVNQWPNITNLDRLLDKRFGDLWYVDAVVRSFQPIELRIQATRKPPETAREFSTSFSSAFEV